MGLLLLVQFFFNMVPSRLLLVVFATRQINPHAMKIRNNTE